MIEKFIEPKDNGFSLVENHEHQSFKDEQGNEQSRSTQKKTFYPSKDALILSLESSIREKTEIIDNLNQQIRAIALDIQQLHNLLNEANGL